MPLRQPTPRDLIAIADLTKYALRTILDAYVRRDRSPRPSTLLAIARAAAEVGCAAPEPEAKP